MHFWAQVDTPQSWGYFKRQDIPWHFDLAEAYTIGDAYHVRSSSFPVRFQQTNILLRPVSLRILTQTDGFGRFMFPCCSSGNYQSKFLLLFRIIVGVVLT